MVIPAGSSFVVLPGKKMAFKKISAALLACALLSGAASAAPAAGKAEKDSEIAAAADAFELQAKDADPEKRARAAAGISGLKTAKKAAVLKSLLNDKDPRVKAVAAKALARDGDAAAYPVLTEALAGPDAEARRIAVEGLARLKDPRSEKPLIALLGHEDLYTRWKAVEALGNFSGGGVVKALLSVVSDEGEDAKIRRSAITALVKTGDKAAVAGLKSVKSAVPKIEKLAARAAALLEKNRQGSGR